MPKATANDTGIQCDAFRKGESHFRRGNFREAVLQFTSALSLQANRLDILDARATALQRLGKDVAARTDAGKMIHLDPGDPRGYLRLGRLFAMSGRVEEARETYEKGIKASRVSHPLQSKLSDQLERLKGSVDRGLAKECGRGTRDPLKALPREVILLILSYLDTVSLFTLLQVSPAWGRMLAEDTLVWTRLRFDTLPGTTGKSFCLDNKTFDKLAHLSGRRLRELHMPLAPRLTSMGLKALVKHRCYGIRSLTVPMKSKIEEGALVRTLMVVGANLTTLSLANCNLSLQTILHLLSRHLSLECVILDGNTSLQNHPWPGTVQYPGIRRLSLREIHFRGGVVPPGLWEAFPNLLELDLSRGPVGPLDMLEAHGRLGSLEALRISWSGKGPAPDFPLVAQKACPFGAWWPKMRQVYMARHTDVADALFAQVLPKWTRLQSLDVAHTSITDQTLILLSKWCPMLRELDISYPRGGSGVGEVVGAVGIEALVRGCPDLCKLLVCGHQGMRNSILEDYLSRAHSLTHLAMDRCPGITGKGIVSLVHGRGRSLQWLSVQDCEGLGPEVIQWVIGKMGSARVCYGTSPFPTMTNRSGLTRGLGRNKGMD